MALEDHGLFNAGFGSVLTLDGRVEMDAALMVAELSSTLNANVNIRKKTATRVRAGGVVLVGRVRNPILLSRVVMDRTPHVLMAGRAAERLAREAGLRMCRPEQLVTDRARNRWLATLQAPGKVSRQHGTVGAVAVDQAGNVAAATSTGGVSGKMAGRIGDSALIGAGLFAAANGAASATGTGEAIMKSCLCREAVALLTGVGAQRAAVRAINVLYASTGAEAGLIMIDSRARFGYAHNAEAMEIALFAHPGEIRHLVLDPIAVGASQP